LPSYPIAINSFFVSLVGRQIWPPDLEEGLIRLFGEKTLGVYELTPLRKDDVRAAVDAEGLRSDEFLSEIERLSAGSLASCPITLKFLINSYRVGKGLPLRRADLYREGCRVLCDEWRHVRRRGRRKYSAGQRFATASKVAAVSVFCRRAAISTAPLHEPIAEGDVHVEDLIDVHHETRPLETPLI